MKGFLSYFFTFQLFKSRGNSNGLLLFHCFFDIIIDVNMEGEEDGSGTDGQDDVVDTQLPSSLTQFFSSRLTL